MIKNILKKGLIGLTALTLGYSGLKCGVETKNWPHYITDAEAKTIVGKVLSSKDISYNKDEVVASIEEPCDMHIIKIGKEVCLDACIEFVTEKESRTYNAYNEVILKEKNIPYLYINYKENERLIYSGRLIDKTTLEDKVNVFIDSLKSRNIEPVAKLNCFNNSIKLYESVKFNGSESYDPDFCDKSYSNLDSCYFDFKDGTTYAESKDNAPDGGFDCSTEHTFKTINDIAPVLYVKDKKGSTSPNVNCSISIKNLRDQYEEDDVIDQAKPFTLKISQEHNLYDDNSDWVYFDANPDNYYNISINESGYNCDPYFEVYGSDKKTKINSNFTYPSFNPDAIDRYYLRVTEDKDSNCKDTKYILNINNTTRPTDDSYEEDDAVDQAKPLTVGSSQNHNHARDSSDWVYFDADKDYSYDILTSSLGSSADTVLYLYSTDKTTQITYNDDANSYTNASNIAFRPSSSGKYYIKTRGINSGSNTEYTLNINSTFAIPDDSYEEDDIYSQAKSFTIGSPQNHNHARDFSDWIYFYGGIGYLYDLSTSNLGTSGDTILELYQSNGTTLITSDDNSGSCTNCSKISYIPQSQGNFYVKIKEKNDASGSNKDYTLNINQTYIADSYEEDDTYSQANSFSIGSPQNHNHYDDSSDWIYFYKYPSYLYDIFTSNLGTSGDTILELYQSNGTTLITSDDNSGSCTNCSKISYIPQSQGNFYVKIKEKNDASGSNKDYTLNINRTYIADSYEEDDTYSQAKSFTIGSQQNYNHYDDSSDWVYFDANTSFNYTITSYNLGSSGDTVLELYDSNGTSLITSNDNGGPCNLCSKIEYIPIISGQKYVKIRESNNNYGNNREYSINIDGIQDDNYEDDDIYTQAKLITIGTPQQHKHLTDSSDWVYFDANTSFNYTITSYNLGSSGDTVLELYDSNGTSLITSNDNGGPCNLCSKIEYIPTSSNTYYIKARESNNSYGHNKEYSLKLDGILTLNDAYEEDDTYSQAKSFTIGSQQNYNHYDDSSDWVYFNVNNGYNYTIETLNLGTSSDTVLELYDSNGTTNITSDDDSGSCPLCSKITYIPSSSGTRYVKTRQYNNNPGTNKEYSLKITQN